MQASVFCAVSLDGFLAGLDDSLEWLNPFGAEPHGYEEFIATVDAIVLGRRTFDVVMAFGGWHFTKPVFVLSSTLKLPKLPEKAVCEVMCGEPEEVTAELGRRGFHSLYVDGGITVQRFLRAGLIQRMIVTRAPILLGSGIPLFGALPQVVSLKHVATRTYKNGLVQSEYALDQ
jgi:dihydrofolate reductase